MNFELGKNLELVFGECFNFMYEDPIRKLTGELSEAIILIIQLLENNNEKNWSRGFKVFLNHIKNNYPIKDIARSIVSCYGGMGSFNDLVLMRGGKFLIEENNMLVQYQGLIYKLCAEIITYKI